MDKKELVDQKKDNVFLCRYHVPSLLLSKGKEKMKLDFTNILSIEKLDDYEFNIRSVLKIKIRIDIKRKIWILKNKRDIVAKFELNKVGLERNNEKIIVGPEVVWNSEFGIYLTDDDEATDTKSLEQITSDKNDLNNDDYFTSQDGLDIYLYNNKLLNASKKVVNKVFSSAPLQHVVGELLTESGHKKVIMSRFENDSVYKELVVPMNSLYKSLIYLDQYYGFYKRGAVIYYDIDKLYIINPNGKVTAKETDEWVETVFLIPFRDKATPGNGMVRKPKQKVFYINIPEENINIQKPSISKNAQYGSEAKIVVTDDIIVETSKADQSIMNQRNEFIRYKRKDDNKFTSTIIQARMEENENIIYISGENFDINAFAVNKTFKLIFEEPSKQKLYGKNLYRVAYAYHFIVAESETWMKSSHQIVLKKCSKLS